MAILYDMKVSVAEAKNRLTELIKVVENGEAVTICRRGKPVVDLVVTKDGDHSKPKLGTLRGKVIEVDPDWWKPMTDEEVDDFLEGRY
jgi:prevent-host-death family protein